MKNFMNSSLLHVLLGHQIKDDEMGGTCSKHGDMRNECKFLVGEIEGKGALGRPRRSWMLE
jgi:hypothetical protein